MINEYRKSARAKHSRHTTNKYSAKIQQTAVWQGATTSWYPFRCLLNFNLKIMEGNWQKTFKSIITSICCFCLLIVLVLVLCVVWSQVKIIYWEIYRRSQTLVKRNLVIEIRLRGGGRARTKEKQRVVGGHTHCDSQQTNKPTMMTAELRQESIEPKSLKRNISFVFLNFTKLC